MLALRCLPLFVRVLLRGLPGVFRHRHQLVFSWLLLMQIITPGRKTLANMARCTPSHIAAWHFRRLLKASYWSLRSVLIWFAQEAMRSFPAPEDGVIYLIGDGSHKDKRGKKHPAAQRGKQSCYTAYFFGIKFVLLIVSWDIYRIPVDFELVLPKHHQDYQKENTLFRLMIQRFQPPEWVQRVIVIGDTAFASRDNMNCIQQRNREDKQRPWYFLFAIARTWKQANGKSLKNLVNYLPRCCYRRTWIPWLAQGSKRKSFWVFAKRTKLRHIGDVTLVLSKKRPNDAPKHTKLLVTNLPDVSARAVVAIYARRWQVEMLIRELKSDLGLGQHQVTGDIPRTEKSFGIAILAYLFLLRARKQDIKPDTPWSLQRLQTNFIRQVLLDERAQCEKRWLRRLEKARCKAA